MNRFIALALLALSIAGCQVAYFEKNFPIKESALGEELIAKLAARDFSAIEPQLDTKLRTPDVREKLEQMARALPPGEPKSVRTVGSNTRTVGTATTYSLTYEYEYPESWVVANVVLERRDGEVTLKGLHVVSPTKQSLAATNRFTFEGKGIAHYIVFVLAVAIPLFIVYALVACARTKIQRRKWFWLLFITFGFAQFQFNWTDGAWGIQPIYFAAFGIGFVKYEPMAPWIITLTFPLGALVFLAKRRSLQHPDSA